MKMVQTIRRPRFPIHIQWDVFR